MTFCEVLRALIEERGITQKKLAGDLCIAVSTMGGYVQGTSEPDFDTLKRIAAYFGVSSDYLLGIHTGKSNSHAEDSLLQAFRSMTPEQQMMYLEQGKAVVKLNHKRGTESAQRK